jgi:gamma-glutamyltranspeptidase/glutathione hydrolase
MRPPPASPRAAGALSRLVAAVVLIVAPLAPAPWVRDAHAAAHPPVTARRAMVAADSAVASRIGLDILHAGGDAVDAAVATALVLGVVQPFASGLGGGGFALVFRADAPSAPPFTLDFRETAPAAATADMYLDARGEVVPKASTHGPRAAAVPGELAGLYAVHRRFGRLPWARVVEPALRLARDGFPASGLLALRIARQREAIAGVPGLAVDLLHADGRPKLEGESIRRPALARTLARIARDGADALYSGDLGRALVAAMARDGGLITAADLAAYRVVERTPLHIDWRGHRIYSMPPPSSGGAVLLQVLRVLEPDDLPALGHNSSRYLHRLTEALKHAFADRAAVMGDPGFTPVPVNRLLDDETIASIRVRTRPHRTLPPDHYGQAPAPPDDAGTSHLSVVDAAGNAVALTTTVNTNFGSFYVAGETGLLMNNEMDDFVARPGVPNAFGLVGRAANAIAPGKRPLSSMTPTIVVRDGRAVLVVGASGGPTIITGTLQVLLNVLAFGLDPEAAVTASRLHHQWLPNTLVVEEDLPADVVDALERRGHAVTRQARYNAVQVIERTAEGLRGASDPSKRGHPAGE